AVLERQRLEGHFAEQVASDDRDPRAPAQTGLQADRKQILRQLARGEQRALRLRVLRGRLLELLHGVVALGLEHELALQLEVLDAIGVDEEGVRTVGPR